MRFYADLHLHSKYSRATSRDCDLEHLSLWAQKKGITVIGTGDFTHPVWIAEIKEKLVPAEPGLFRLREDIERDIAQRLPSLQHLPTRFMLEVEISTIYKKGEKTRKVHHLIYAPDLEKADRVIKKLGSIGNIRSDGRPILGLDSRHLLEITLEAGEGCYLVPAHIWTPWFSAMGSKSGFDSIDECYGDLAQHIFAVETGLSSDPEMNWRISHLDRFRLVSNSDAHSPEKLGREACLFTTDLNYFSMKEALQTGKGYGGTVEFFPEEGKYHMDGHRKCKTRLSPQESKEHQGRCPVCHTPLTLGVMYRVEELADRPAGARPESVDQFANLIPLAEILGETLGVGPKSKGVQKNYEALLSKLGTELSILNDLPLEEVRKYGSSLLAEGIARMRRGDVIREAGYDGEYGVIRVFDEKELKNSFSSGALFKMEELVTTVGDTALLAEGTPFRGDGDNAVAGPAVVTNSPFHHSRKADREGDTDQLDEEQQKALEIVHGPLLIIAGPGSGKTRTLTHRIAHLIQKHGVMPETMLNITFTRRAAEEMKHRLCELLPALWRAIPVMTFHSFGLQVLQEYGERMGIEKGFRLLSTDEQEQCLQERCDLSAQEAKQALKIISRMKRGGEEAAPDSKLKKIFFAYRQMTRESNLLDYDDLILLAVKGLQEHTDFQLELRRRFQWISIDEYQDIDEHQYALIKLLTPSNGNICAIGDPDQAIYGFRGSDVRFFFQFEHDFPQTKTLCLTKNYRSAHSILSASTQVIKISSLVPDRESRGEWDNGSKIVIHEAATDRAEAEFIVHTIERFIGGSTFFSLDSGRAASHTESSFSFSDFSILYRTEAQAALITEALARSGMPFQAHSHGLEQEQQVWDPRADRIVLMTLHASKGLEFPVVFIAGCEEGLLPLSWGGKTDEQALAEERRLFFVGMTRAMERLCLSYARKRRIYGKVKEQSISPFLKDIQRNLLEQSRTPQHHVKKKEQLSQLDLF